MKIRHTLFISSLVITLAGSITPAWSQATGSDDENDPELLAVIALSLQPQGQDEVPLGIRDILIVLGMLGILFGAAARKATGASLVPTKDARLKQSLAFDNY